MSTTLSSSRILPSKPLLSASSKCAISPVRKSTRLLCLRRWCYSLILLSGQCSFDSLYEFEQLCLSITGRFPGHDIRLQNGQQCDWSESDRYHTHSECMTLYPSNIGHTTPARKYGSLHSNIILFTANMSLKYDISAQNVGHSTSSVGHYTLKHREMPSLWTQGD